MPVWSHPENQIIYFFLLMSNATARSENIDEPHHCKNLNLKTWASPN
jgi:hypothetical protein